MYKRECKSISYNSIYYAQPCTFTYNGVKYAGFHINVREGAQDSSSVMTYIELDKESLFEPFQVFYLSNYDLEHPLNQEVYDSLVLDDPSIGFLSTNEYVNNRRLAFADDVYTKYEAQTQFQTTLTQQTEYSSKGSASKIPVITTNHLGQVTSIQEEDVSVSSLPATAKIVHNGEEYTVAQIIDALKSLNAL